MLRKDMEKLVKRAIAQAKDGFDHYEICHSIAREFDLYGNNLMFPVWLSRVVEGVLNDVGRGDCQE